MVIVVFSDINYAFFPPRPYQSQDPDLEEKRRNELDKISRNRKKLKGKNPESLQNKKEKKKQKAETTAVDA